MKVVLFCGGFGMRMRDGDSDVPKPMQKVGPRPLLWHVMRYYAHFGHKEFILCLGYGSHHIKDYFLNYRETESNDFVLRQGDLELKGSDIAGASIDVAAGPKAIVVPCGGPYDFKIVASVPRPADCPPGTEGRRYANDGHFDCLSPRPSSMTWRQRCRIEPRPVV